MSAVAGNSDIQQIALEGRDKTLGGVKALLSKSG